MILFNKQCALAIVGLAFLAPVSAAGSSAGAAVPELDASSMFSALFSLVVVIAAIVAVAWLARRLQRGRFRDAGVLRVVATQSLGTRERVVLLDVGGKQLLVGVTAQHVNRLLALDEPLDVEPPSLRTSAFATKLGQMMKGASG